MKAIIISFFLSLYAGSMGTSSANYVYICTGPQAKVYHSKESCRGQNKCSGSIKKITEGKAKSMGRRKCRICF